MEDLIDIEWLNRTYAIAEAWVIQEVLTLSTLGQLIVVLVAFLVAKAMAPIVSRGIEKQTSRWRSDRTLQHVQRIVSDLVLAVLWLAVQWLCLAVAVAAAWPSHVIEITTTLLVAWVVIRFMSQLVRDPLWSRTIAITAWSLAALSIIGLLDEAIATLDAFAFSAGDLRISALTVIKGLLALGMLLWVATVLSLILERRIASLPNLTPSVQVLFSKLLKIVLIVIAIVTALSIVGIDLTAFALFSGAIGVGIGFGLQKVVSNLISGVILLMDKSVKPGDVIEVGGVTYGWINTLGARYASVVTRDGYEYLIPNEDIITQQVVNWSYSNNAVRLKIPIGVSYKSDIRKAIALCQEAAAAEERVLKEPKSVCLLKGFGDSAVDLELRIWINDPQNGISNIKSQVLLGVWDRLHEHNIVIPFPQRDLHLVSAEGLPKTKTREAED